jgi:predicted dehydrogenase
MAFVRHTAWQGRAADVDVVRDLMIHDIDLALTLARARVAAVAASGAAVITTSYDVAEARIEVASGCRLTADFAAPGLSVTSHAEGGPIENETIPLASADNLAAEIKAFLGSIETGATATVDGRAGLDAVQVADMILAAIARRAVSPSVNGDATP